MRLDRIGSVAEARRAAARVLPRVVFDYIDGGADDEVTMHANEAAFADVVFRPRMALDAGAPDLATTVLGRPLALPIMLAPCGLVRLMHPEAGSGVARAAAERGTISVLSTVAGSPVEQVAPAAPGTVWFQLYAAGGRPDAEAMVARVEQAGVDVLVVTVDTPALGNRERDRRHGVGVPLRLDARNGAALGYQVLTRPSWAFRMARDGISFASRPGARKWGGPPRGAPLTGNSPDLTDASGLAGAGGLAGARGPEAAGSPDEGAGGRKPSMLSMAASPFLWTDIAWLRDRWKGKLLVKGLLTGDDARRAVETGADAVIVSNHGGRQLDGAPATLAVLPEIVEATGDHAEVLFDGGVRRGAHVVKALALGAKAVFIGRPYLWGLAAGGQAGVERVIDILETEMARTMTLLGCSSVGALGSDWVG